MDESKIEGIFNDVIEVESKKEYLDLNHNLEKREINFSLSVKERYLVSDLLSEKYSFDPLNNEVEKILEFAQNESIGKIADSLKKDGYYVLKNKLSEEFCDEIKSELEKIPFRIRGSKKNLIGVNEKTIKNYKANALWALNQNDILSIPEIQKIAFDSRILNIIGSFFNAPPILCQTNSWWSKSHSNHRSNLSSNAQLYHQDLDYLKFIKVFIYLKDINENNGPHKYVVASSLAAEQELGEGYKLNSRLDEELVENIFGSENIKTFTGQKGTIIIENTLGLHRGTPVVEGSRLLVQLQYTNSLYFHGSQYFDPKILIEELIPFKKQHQRVFNNFTEKAESLNTELIKRNSSMTFKKWFVSKIKKFI